jgi:hypothetical protein
MELSFLWNRVVYFQENKKDEGQGKEKCHTKSMMSNGVNERIKIYTQDVHLDRTQRKKYEGRSQKRCGTTRTNETRKRHGTVEFIFIRIKQDEDQGIKLSHSNYNEYES